VKKHFLPSPKGEGTLVAFSQLLFLCFFVGKQKPTPNKFPFVRC